MLYRKHFDDVVAYFARRVSSPHDVADLVAETFVRAVANAARYDPGAGAPLAWLFGIARNVQFEYWRSGQTQRDTARRLSGRRLLDDEDVTRLEERIDAERVAASCAVTSKRCPSGSVSWWSWSISSG